MSFHACIRHYSQRCSGLPEYTGSSTASDREWRLRARPNQPLWPTFSDCRLRCRVHLHNPTGDHRRSILAGVWPCSPLRRWGLSRCLWAFLQEHTAESSQSPERDADCILTLNALVPPLGFGIVTSNRPKPLSGRMEQPSFVICTVSDFIISTPPLPLP